MILPWLLLSLIPGEKLILRYSNRAVREFFLATVIL